MAHDLCWKELNNANLHIVCMPGGWTYHIAL